MQKKAAVLIYPHFSMQEISCLTAALAVYHEWKIDVFGAEKSLITSEDGFQVMPGRLLEDFDPKEYACLILPGILNPLPALFDDRIILFLKKQKRKKLLIAAISSGPILLAKAGLLEGVRFTSGIWEDICRHHDFIPHENIVRRPVVEDKNIITAIGFAYREFAMTVLRRLELLGEGEELFRGVYKDFTAEELTFLMKPEHFDQWKRMYAQHEAGAVKP